MRIAAFGVGSQPDVTHPAKPGVLLVNLGTPDAPETPEVRRYLRQFLIDERVLDINAFARWCLVNLIIAPTRGPKSAEAYKKVWLDRGSPLLVHGRDLTEVVRTRLPEFEVELAMRYGNPSIDAGLTKLRDAGCDELVIMPLYPQYASSSTGSSLDAVYRAASKLWNTPFFSVVPPFYDHPGFIDAFVEVAKPKLDEQKPDHLLFSFHGLPVRHLQKSDPSGSHCWASDSCCDTIVSANRNCYRAQCFVTARMIAERLGMDESDYTICFQSRLSDGWVTPYTDDVLVEVAKKGVKNLAVMCPAFVADCLETIEEIGMRAEEDFTEAGGERLELIPSLNATPTWADAVASMVREAAGTRRLRVLSESAAQ